MNFDSRFWEKVDAAGDCWQWTASRNRPNGYGIYSRRGRRQCAHRIAWADLVGDVPEDMQLDHLCRNRGCVNPDHLQIVTPQENGRRGYGPSGIAMRRTSCTWGHPWTAQNTFWYRGYRTCRACNREKQWHRHRGIRRERVESA